MVTIGQELYTRRKMKRRKRSSSIASKARLTAELCAKEPAKTPEKHMNQAQLEKNIVDMLGHLGFAEGRHRRVIRRKGPYALVRHHEGPHTRLLFSRDAEGLAALNHIATKMAEQLMREDDKRPRVVIDANGHEKKKIEALRTTAHMMAERARYFKSSVAIDPMPPHERRIVHEFLAEMPDLETESEGVGEKRHIVIKYKGRSSERLAAVRTQERLPLAAA